MLRARTLRIFAGLLIGYALLTSAAYWGPGYLAAMGSFFILVPYLSIYIFHRIGIPGLLEHNGLCGWGWCAPTKFGWAFLVTFWIGIAWIVALGLARPRARGVAHTGHDL
jgi:hypothetical protein